MKIVIGILAAAGLATAANAVVTIVPGSATYTTIVGQAGTTAIAGVSDDSEHNITTTVGNSLMPAGQVTIGNNGVVLFGTVGAPPQIGFTNNAFPVGTASPTGLPVATSFFSGLAPLWDDHFPIAGQGGNTIFFRQDPGVLTIEWFNEDHFSAPGTGTITFQMQVFSSGPVLARFLYPDTTYVAPQVSPSNGLSATVGFVAGSSGEPTNVQFSHNMGVILDGLVLDVIPAPGAMALLGLGGLMVSRRRRA